MQTANSKFEVGDLVEYSDNLPFAMHSTTIGIVIEILDLKTAYSKLEEDDNPDYAKGFLEEMKMFHALRELERKPDMYPEDRQRMLEKMLNASVDGTEVLIKVVWTNGDSYIEHPTDLKIVLRVKEVPDENDSNERD